MGLVELTLNLHLLLWSCLEVYQEQMGAQNSLFNTWLSVKDNCENSRLCLTQHLCVVDSI